MNPVGPPVRGKDFYGRDSFVEIVWEKLKGGNVLLAAPRRFGKTSVMYRLIDEPRWEYKFVHADLQHLTEPSELVTLLVVQLARDSRLSKIASGLSYFPKRIWSGFTKNFEEIELLKLKVKLRDKVRSNWKESGEELFKRVATSQTSIVFILDELPMMIDRMARSEAHREEAKTMLRWLRALRTSPSTQNVRFLIAGSIGIDRVLNDLGEIASINDFEQLHLPPFTPKVAAAFLDELAETHKIQLSQPSKRKMLQLIGTLIPYFIRVIFSEVYNAYKLQGEQITPTKVEQIYRDKVLGVNCKTYFDHYYSRFRDYYQPDEEKAIKRILRQLALDERLTRDVCYQFYREKLGDRADIENFNRLMTDLENDFYIRYDPDKHLYEFASKLLRDWWLRHYGMEADV
jgi:AAA+ ATPase superfamily predicted ATPase